MQRRWLGLGAVVVTALGSACCAPKWIGSVKFMSSPAGESMLVEASAVVWRVKYLRRHSLENGALLASAQFLHECSRSYHVQCEPARPGRLWCLETSSDPLCSEGLSVRDAESLRLIAAQNHILRVVRRTPELAGTRGFEMMRVDPKTRGFVFESRDGYTWIIDPTTLAPARLDETVSASPSLDPDSSPTDPTDTGYQYEFTGGTRKTLVRSGPSAQDPPVRLHPEHTYLHGQVVTRFDNPPRVLVVEDVVDHGPTLWCLSADGTVQWKVTDLSGPPTQTKQYRDMIVLVTSSMLVAVRTQDGAVVWTSPP
jgi:hypothetical protein